MSSLNKRMRKSDSEEKPKSGKGGKYTQGRWTEKEHYLFLLAVKEYGKDWKKIEGYVKTRNATQARSHAQKVLKDDIMLNIDEEIRKYASIYEKPAEESPLVQDIPASKMSSNGSSRGPKAKRARKRVSKMEDESQEQQRIIQIYNVSPPASDAGVKSSSSYDEESVDSDSSYNADTSEKLFSIEKMTKSIKKNRRKTRGKKRVPLPPKNELEPRKDSVSTSATMPVNQMCSPAKTASETPQTLLPKMVKLSTGMAVSPKKTENETKSKHKNGCEDDKPLSNLTSNQPKIVMKSAIKRQMSLVAAPSAPLVEAIPEDNSCKNTSSVLRHILSPDSGNGPNFVNKSNMELEELGWNIFDSFVEYELKNTANYRKMTRDEPSLGEDLMETTLLMGDRKFPLFDQY